MIHGAVHEIIIPNIKNTLKHLSKLSHEYRSLPIIARTHGQPAVPTTLGKEFSVFGLRILKKTKQLEKHKLTGKLNGAVGNYSALHFNSPNNNWVKISKEFVKSLGLEFNENTTQTNPPEDLTELFSIIHSINSILLDLSNDIWRYISDDWLILKTKSGEIGSSTMPQKVNPIDFENSEGNVAVANSLFEMLIRKLPISRLQRDLSDSTVSRNIGAAFGYSLLSIKGLNRGLGKIRANKSKIKSDLYNNWNILGEALQTKAKTKQLKSSYEKTTKVLKQKSITQNEWIMISKEIDKELTKLTPSTYIGLSVKLTESSARKIDRYLSR